MTISQINPSQLRPSDDDGIGPIVKIGPERLLEAVDRLVGPASQPNREHGRRFIEYARSHGIRLEHMWSRLDRAGQVEATVLAVPSPGRTAMVFASQPARHDKVGSLAGLIDHSAGMLPPLNVSLAQALLDPTQAIERQAFRGGGFVDLATLSYVERPLRPSRGVRLPPPQWPAGVAPIRFEESMHQTLVEVLDQSYEDTLDCAGLRGYRLTEDILEGHRASGVFEASLWTILEVDGQPSGALLLNPASDRMTIELVYLGLIKSVRGRGLGAQLLRHGLKLLEGRREHSIHLAVDEANKPALALYRREGFRLAMRRSALIRPM